MTHSYLDVNTLLCLHEVCGAEIFISLPAGGKGLQVFVHPISITRKHAEDQKMTTDVRELKFQYKNWLMLIIPSQNVTPPAHEMLFNTSVSLISYAH